MRNTSPFSSADSTMSSTPSTRLMMSGTTRIFSRYCSCRRQSSATVNALLTASATCASSSESAVALALSCDADSAALSNVAMSSVLSSIS